MATVATAPIVFGTTDNKLAKRAQALSGPDAVRDHTSNVGINKVFN
jgi:hypothetical protein